MRFEDESMLLLQVFSENLEPGQVQVMSLTTLNLQTQKEREGIV